MPADGIDEEARLIAACVETASESAAATAMLDNIRTAGTRKEYAAAARVAIAAHKRTRDARLALESYRSKASRPIE
jgi:hypothetical protein